MQGSRCKIVLDRRSLGLYWQLVLQKSKARTRLRALLARVNPPSKLIERDIERRLSDNLPKSISDAADLLAQRVRELTCETTSRWFPLYGDGISGVSSWVHELHWTAGFWVGLNWLAYAYTHEERYLNTAIRFWGLMRGYEKEFNFHDQGFRYYYSAALGWKLTKDAQLRESALAAANLLVSMFNTRTRWIPMAGKFRRKNDDTILDTMINIQLLWWAFRETGQHVYYDVAFQHTERTMQEHLRSDGSTWESVRYNPVTGDIYAKYSIYEGLPRWGKAWSRGQGWAILGFAYAYKATNYSPFLEAVKRLVEFVDMHLPDDRVPFVFYDMADYGYKDTSAGAVTACGLLELSNTLSESEPEYAKKCMKLADEMIGGLLSRYLRPLSHDDRGKPGVLTEGWGHAANPQRETVFGTYYLFEAIMRRLEFDGIDIPALG